jgi:hypothetical protein
MKRPNNPAKYKWPPGSPQPARRSFAFDDGPVTSFDDYEAAMQRKAAAQARERARLGLEPADFVDFGCEGEPRKPD